MIGMYLLVALISQLSVNPFLPISDVSPFQCVVELEQPNGVRTGAPVLADGSVIGSVRYVMPASSAAVGQLHDGTANKLSVTLDIGQHYRELMKKGAVAVVSSSVTTISSEPQTVIELFSPPGASEQLGEGARIRGFTSFEQFWAKGFSA
jgi:hypothetical protein